MTGKLCPSAQPDMAGAQVLGVHRPGQDVAYVAGTVPVTDAVLAATGDVPPTLVYRFAAPCAEKRCGHFDGERCQLATRIAAKLSPVETRLPACAIRKTCRWHGQEGSAACLRCPQVTTTITEENDPLRDVAFAAE
ncbi:hypothetical protein GGQ68_002964 [Sagittula marina]|uniref:Nitrogen fixation protein n=1 Tax=Sagittula marina TaxID=943940 RepID=A0A7W6DRY3_9RHOB|nr:hypothetical protein [Sagittula marina]MBB3986621.1 hypothetical protein [Sagittula marina]